VGRATAAALGATATEQFGVLVTFAQPWSDHLVGLRVRRTSGLPWVAHFSDPWADSLYGTARQRAIWRRMEEPVVREASKVVFVSQETADLVMRKYPDAWRSKAAVVPHGYDTIAPGVRAPEPAEGRPLRLVYTGRFYRGVRTPLPLFHALRKWIARNGQSGALHVTFVGPHTEEFRRDAAALGLDSMVSFKGRMAPTEAARAAASADALLVIDAPSDGPGVFLPSKLIDYLPLRKPIAGITPSPGASASLLRRLGCRVAPPDDIDAIAAMLDALVAQWRAGTLQVSPAFDEVAAEFDIRSTTARLHDVLAQACAEPH
jgi:glycosyltransferase involved in cell wall biosynthesis